VPLGSLKEEGADFAVLFYNPNIGFEEENRRRFEAFRFFAADLGMRVIEGPYEPDAWEAALGPAAGSFPLIAGDPDYDENLRLRKNRCRACYAFRFARLAKVAKSGGYGAISTTLSISPYQFTDIMAEELATASRAKGLTGAFVDYRPYYAESVKRSRELAMYRQNYCGCRFSLVEAESERSDRKASGLLRGTCNDGDELWP